MKKMNNKGFSLVELIIVIAIMAVLIGVLAPQFMRYVESARQSTDMDNVNSMKAAVEAYVADELVTTGSFTIKVSSTEAEVGSTGWTPPSGHDSITTYCDNLGISTSGKMAFRSGGWPTSAVTFTYDTSTFKWTGPASGGAPNSKNPKKDMADVFK